MFPKIFVALGLFYISINFATYYFLTKGEYHLLLFYQFVKGYPIQGWAHLPTEYLLSCAASLLFLALPFSKKESFEKYGYAKIAQNSDIKKMRLLSDEGVILGRKGINKRTDRESMTLFDRLHKWIIDGDKDKYLRFKEPLSVLVLAPSGVGKTTSLVIPNLYYLRNSIIVHDPKGEIYEQTHKHRRKFNRILLFDPVNKNTSRFNPLCASLLPKGDYGRLDYGKLRSYIENIGTTLIPKEADAKSAFFNDTARQAFIFVAEWLCWKDGQTSLPAIYNLITSGQDFKETLDLLRYGIDPRKLEGSEELEEILEELVEDPNKGIFSSHPYYQLGFDETEMPSDFINDLNSITVSSGGSEQWAGVLGTINQHMNIFADKNVAASTSGESDLLPQSFREIPSTLYAIVRDEDRDRLRGVIHLLFESLANGLLSKMPKEDDIRVTFLLDEFTRLGKLKVLQKMPEISRGYNVQGIFIAQDYGQIKSVYDKDTVDIFETNTAYKVIFSQNNFETAKRVSQMIGNKTVQRTSESKSKNKGGEGKSESTSEEGMALITAQDLQNLDKTKVVILAQHHFARPILTDSAYWENDPEIVKNINKEPEAPLIDTPNPSPELLSPAVIVTPPPEEGYEIEEPQKEPEEAPEEFDEDDLPLFNEEGDLDIVDEDDIEEEDDSYEDKVNKLAKL